TACVAMALILMYLRFTSFGGRHRYDVILSLEWAGGGNSYTSIKPILRRHTIHANLASQHDLEADKVDLSYRLLLRDPVRSRELFAIALVATIWVWKDYAGTPHGMGEVHAVTVRVAAPHDGHLAEMDAYPRLFDHVNAKQPLARFDASKLIDQQTKADDQKNKLQDELDVANKAVEEATKAGA